MEDNVQRMILLVVILFIIFSFLTGFDVTNDTEVDNGALDPASPLLLYDQP
ncbi:hypothetical protein [Halalkalibacter hemicellulosilyticus]|uniref:Uncharacterized protein n=1 Tax=Halalkalibacter hemicellulosilyticusJCM 9152 TaxID=1236971 RepID=W4QGM5_9BACI|nr:hypothetical protein [Halalkalibacter hemicellulosilyticus]GAE31241.1 hypothetical protein JCM9152_2697 [Halalkalibacter hemicellulosilyticusJCM 9152]